MKEKPPYLFAIVYIVKALVAFTSASLHAGGCTQSARRQVGLESWMWTWIMTALI
jgi:hypothetical protein